MKLLVIFFLSLPLYAKYANLNNVADWSNQATIPLGTSRENIYQLNPEKLKQYQKDGYIHALIYPVSVTGLLMPFDPLKNFLEADTKNPIKKIIRRITNKKMGFKTVKGFYQWLGLNEYPQEGARGVFKIPYPNGTRPEFFMGATLMQTKHAKGLTFSCAACHTATLFGKPIMGLTNRRVRANSLFKMAKKTVRLIPSGIFQVATGASKDERKMFKRTKKNLRSVDAIYPQVLGLDTSLPQVALSLARRNPDEYATKSKFYEKFPRKNELTHFVSDSKPAVWWNLKYKTRWLSDGSIVAGNPILTNFLWNELGRGTDLKALEKWMQDNQKTIDQLTVAAFSTKAPRWTDFFAADSIDIASAKRGEANYLVSCKKCHGVYEKGWSSENVNELTPTEQLATTKIIYHEKTPVKDVGTDPQRWMGTKYFSENLNKLAISKWMKTVVRPQMGYVPPPLVGIFARYPYFHNNSIPNLCALLTIPKNRPTTFIQGPSIDPETDFQAECVGYPVGADIPKEWKKDKSAFFDTTKPGLGNMGHSRMLLNKDGTEKYSQNEKLDIINFLKTL